MLSVHKRHASIYLSLKCSNYIACKIWRLTLTAVTSAVDSVLFLGYWGLQNFQLAHHVGPGSKCPVNCTSEVDMARLQKLQLGACALDKLNVYLRALVDDEYGWDRGERGVGGPWLRCFQDSGRKLSYCLITWYWANTFQKFFRNATGKKKVFHQLR